MNSTKHETGDYTCDVCGYEFTDFRLDEAKKHEEECNNVDKFRDDNPTIQEMTDNHDTEPTAWGCECCDNVVNEKEDIVEHGCPKPLFTRPQVASELVNEFTEILNEAAAELTEKLYNSDWDDQYRAGFSEGLTQLEEAVRDELDPGGKVK